MVKKKIVTGLLCFFLALSLALGQYLNPAKAQEVEKIAVLVAVRDIAAGTGLKAEDFQLKSIPQEAFSSEMRESLGSAPLYAVVNIPQGSYFLINTVEEKQTFEAVEDQVKVTIKVDLYSALGGRIKPGDRVNLAYVPLALPGERGKTEPGALIAENLLIAHVMNEKGREIGGPGNNNAYGVGENLVPAALTLICHNQEQSLAIKEYEKLGGLFLTMGKEPLS